MKNNFDFTKFIKNNRLLNEALETEAETIPGLESDEESDTPEKSSNAGGNNEKQFQELKKHQQLLKKAQEFYIDLADELRVDPAVIKSFNAGANNLDAALFKALNSKSVNEEEGVEEGKYGSYGGAYASRYDRDMDPAPRAIKSRIAKPVPVDYRKLGEILMLAVKYEMFEKGQIKQYLNGVKNIENLIAGGPEEFDPEEAMSLEGDEFGLEGAYRTPGWKKFDDAMNYSPVAYQGNYDQLASWLNNLNKAVASFDPSSVKAPKNDYEDMFKKNPKLGWAGK
jgi:hypothetical protein